MKKPDLIDRFEWAMGMDNEAMEQYMAKIMAPLNKLCRKHMNAIMAGPYSVMIEDADHLEEAGHEKLRHPKKSLYRCVVDTSKEARRRR